jgi:copper transport protein
MPRRSRWGPGSVPLALLLLLLLAAPQAEAHALPASSTPRAGAVVQALPREAVVTFSERLEGSFSKLEVRDANGTVVSEPHTLDPDGITLRAGLARDLPYGTYTVSWRALSAVDGHVTRGLIPFLFPDPSKPLSLADLPRAEDEQAEALVTPADMVLRALSFVGVFAAFGTAFLVLVVVRPEAPLLPNWDERALALLAAAGAGLAALCSLLLMVTQAMAAAQVGPFEALTRPSALLAGRFGSLAALRVPLLLGAAGLAWMAGPRGVASPVGTRLWTMSAGLAAGALATLTLSSHAAALPQPVLGIAADITHLLFGAAWIGALAGLGIVLFRDDRATALPYQGLAARFSAMATVAAVVVVLTGVLAALLHLRSPAHLLGSPWGQVLVAKVVLVAGLGVLGARNKFVLVPTLRAARGHHEEGEAAKRFGRVVRLEAVLGVLVLVAAGALTAFSPPPPEQSALPPPAVHELTATQDGINASMLISPSPVQVGPSVFDLFLTLPGGASDGNATTALLTLEPPDRTLGSTEVPMDLAHQGHFAAEGTYFTMPGEWSLTIQVKRTNAYDFVTTWRLDVAPAA